MLAIRKAICFLLLICLLYLFASPVFAEEVIPVNGVRLDRTELTIIMGQQGQISAAVVPEGATNTNIEWENSNPEVIDVVAVVDSGSVVQIITLSPGEARLTAVTSDGGYRMNCLVSVIRLVRSIKIDHEDIVLAPGDTKTLSAWVVPRDATEQGIVWESSNPGFVSVDEEGKINAVNVGEARIIARSLENSMISSYITVTVTTEAIIPVETEETDDAASIVDEQLTPLPDIDENNFLIYIVLGVVALFIIAAVLFVLLRSPGSSKGVKVGPGGLIAGQSKGPVLVGLSGLYAGQKFAFNQNQIAIGRDSASVQVVYPQDRDQISRKHCIIYFDQVKQQFVLEDTSSNGTYLASGKRLNYKQQHDLQPGESFSLTESKETFSVELE